MSILDFVPAGITLRNTQKKSLLDIEKNWEEYDAFVLEAPPAAGKSLIAYIVSRWRQAVDQQTAILTPRTMLQDQYQGDLPDIPSLKGKSRYDCRSKYANHCGEFYDATGYYCKGCKYKETVVKVAEGDRAILNFHSHLFGGMTHDMYKDVLIIDEAHNLIPMLSDVYTLQIWQHKEDYPFETHTKDDVIIWLESEINKLQEVIADSRQEYASMSARQRKLVADARRKYGRYKMIKEGLVLPQELFHIAKVSKSYGRSRKKHACIEVKPISLKTVPHQMWPDGDVKKLIFMSATIYNKDIDRLGITRKRVKYIRHGSEIPADNRPLRIDPVGSMSFTHTNTSVPKLAKRIKEIAAEHGGKGLVHITYGLRYQFKKYLTGKQFLWHTEENKDEVYQQFLDSKEDVILMGCGMSEGIDLAGPDYQWQVMTKIVFPSLADPLNKHFTQTDPLVYNLDTVRNVVQSAGRICRSPTDYGVTYILDENFINFYKRCSHLFPKYFSDALQWRSK